MYLLFSSYNPVNTRSYMGAREEQPFLPLILNTKQTKMP